MRADLSNSIGLTKRKLAVALLTATTLVLGGCFETECSAIRLHSDFKVQIWTETLLAEIFPGITHDDMAEQIADHHVQCMEFTEDTPAQTGTAVTTDWQGNVVFSSVHACDANGCQIVD